MARKTREKKKGINVDLSGVETGAGKPIAEGQYPVRVESATLETSNNSGNDYIKMEFEITDGKEKGKKLFHNCSLQPQALFNLKSVLAALGFEIPKKAFDLELNDLIDLECMVEVAHENYEGKKKARIVEFINEEDGDDDDTEEMTIEDLDMDELKQLAKHLGISAKDLKKAKDEEALIDLIEDHSDEDEIQEAIDELFDGDEEDDEEDEEDDEDYEEMTLDELKECCKDRGIKIPKKPKKENLIELLEEDDEE